MASPTWGVCPGYVRALLKSVSSAPSSSVRNHGPDRQITAIAASDVVTVSSLSTTAFQRLLGVAVNSHLTYDHTPNLPTLVDSLKTLRPESDGEPAGSFLTSSVAASAAAGVGARALTTNHRALHMDMFQDFVEIATLAGGAGTVVSCVAVADVTEAANRNRDAARKTRGSFTSGKGDVEGEDNRPGSAQGSDNEGGRPDSPRQRRHSLKEQWTRSLSFSLIAAIDDDSGDQPTAVGASAASDAARVVAKLVSTMQRTSPEVRCVASRAPCRR